MDFLRPRIVNVEGRCYRVNDCEFESSETRQRGVEWDDYPEKYNECTQDEPCDAEDEFDIVVTDSGRYKTSFHVARTYYAVIIGTKGQTRKKLEDETKTIIKIPRLPQDNEIVITGSSKQAVASARRRIQLIVMSYRRKQPFTHFLSIPMVVPTVIESVVQFKQEVLRGCRARGVEESIFQDPRRLHLTLCTLVLNDTFERNEAAEVLQRCKREIVDPIMEGNSIIILLSGLEIMNDDPSEVDVLYAKVNADPILQTLVDDVVDFCSNEGLVEKQFERVKLHVTLMNTTFRDSKPEERGRRQTRETFNALPILEKFQDYEFGEVSIDTIHLSARHTKAESGYYQHTATMSLYM